jgi:hypothetical protein
MPFVNIDPEVKVTGPIPGLLLDPTLRKSIETFRRENCETPYLFSDFHMQLEKTLQIEERSFHLIAHKDGEIMGVMRVTPPPFEISQLGAELNHALEGFSNHLEVSRMVLSKEGRRNWVGVLLCFAVVKWGLQTGHDGLVALCRPANANRFSFLGFRSISNEEFVVSEREHGSYRLLASEWSSFTRKLGMVFGSQLTEIFWQE